MLMFNRIYRTSLYKMKKYSILCLLALLLCCNCTYGKIKRNSKPSPVVENAMTIQVDDSVKCFLGDSISKIIFEADTVKLYSLSIKPPVDSTKNKSVQVDSTMTPNFHGCYIAHDYGILAQSAITPMLLILSDRDNYLLDGIRLKSPFIPSVALSFKKENACVDMIFSFTGGQMYLFMADGEKLYFKYSHERLVMKFFQSFLQDERISQFLNL